MKLGMNDLVVGEGVESGVEMGEVVMVEGGEEVENGMGLRNVGEEVVGEGLGVGGGFEEWGNVENLEGSGEYRVGVEEVGRMGRDGGGEWGGERRVMGRGGD